MRKASVPLVLFKYYTDNYNGIRVGEGSSGGAQAITCLHTEYDEMLNLV